MDMNGMEWNGYECGYCRERKAIGWAPKSGFNLFSAALQKSMLYRLYRLYRPLKHEDED